MKKRTLVRCKEQYSTEIFFLSQMQIFKYNCKPFTCFHYVHYNFFFHVHMEKLYVQESRFHHRFEFFFANVRGGPLGIFGCQMRLTRVELANGIIPRPKADHFSALRFQIFPSHAISHAFFAAVLGRGVRRVHCLT